MGFVGGFCNCGIGGMLGGIMATKFLKIATGTVGIYCLALIATKKDKVVGNIGFVFFGNDAFQFRLGIFG